MNKLLPSIFLPGFVFFLFLLIFHSCTPLDHSRQNNILQNTDYMVFLLDSIANNSDPLKNYHMNSELAEIHRQKLAESTNPQEQSSLFFQYAYQLLNSGQTEEAISQLQHMKQSLNQQNIPLNEQSKIVYDLLAISNLRQGEQQNCVENHTSASCIIPLQKEGFHTLTSGSENAIEVYEEILEKFPNDFNSQWLLNVAYMTLGKYPGEVPKEWLVSLEKPNVGVHIPPFDEKAIDLGLDVLSLSGGVCIEDFNNNGYADIFVTGYGLREQCRLFSNNSEGGFIDATESAGLIGITSGLNAITADYNNDGHTDIFILRGAWLGAGGTHPNSLLKNNGDGTFTDVTNTAGLLSFHPTQTASWADFDGDGFVDLYIGNESNPNQGLIHPNELYRNNGDGTFTNVASNYNLDIAVFSKGVIWGDINNDQKPDLYISVLGGPNRLYVNRGGTNFENWQFEEISRTAGVSSPFFSFPAWFFDFDNDGYEDLLVFDYGLERENLAEELVREIRGMEPLSENMKLYRNLGNEQFEDVTEEMGLDIVTYAMGCNFGDLNNNGFPDFYVGTGAPDFRAIVPNRMFANINGTRFDEVTHLGFGHIQKGHGIAFADLDNDGDQDVYSVQGGAFEGDVAFNLLFENPIENTKWIHLNLVGTQSNKSAIGARIEVIVEMQGGEQQSFFRRVNTGGTFGTNNLRQEIGLGEAKSILSVKIDWPFPDSETTVLTDVPLNSNLLITENQEGFKILDHPAIKLEKPLEGSGMADHGGSHPHHH